MQVAILNGITIGGGAGISVTGTFRVATDKTVRLIKSAFIHLKDISYPLKLIVISCVSMINNS